MDHNLNDLELDAIELRLARAFEVAQPPWTVWLETREATGGCSFIQLGGHPDEDNEMYLDLRLAQQRLVSPDVRLDAVIEFLGNAPDDVLNLLAEVKRLRTLVGRTAASTADGMGRDQP